MFGALQERCPGRNGNPRLARAPAAPVDSAPRRTPRPVTTSDAIYCRQELSRSLTATPAHLDDQGNPVPPASATPKLVKQDATK
ncbi:hypothetical protein ACPA9J_00155 [Pseudomonas aeruginosa]